MTWNENSKACVMYTMPCLPVMHSLFRWVLINACFDGLTLLSYLERAHTQWSVTKEISFYDHKNHIGLFPKPTSPRCDSNLHLEKGGALGRDQHIDEKGRCVLNKIKVRYKCLSIVLLLELHIMQAFFIFSLRLVMGVLVT